MESHSLKSSGSLTWRNGIARKRSTPQLTLVYLFWFREMSAGRRRHLAPLPSLHPQHARVMVGYDSSYSDHNNITPDGCYTLILNHWSSNLYFLSLRSSSLIKKTTTSLTRVACSCLRYNCHTWGICTLVCCPLTRWLLNWQRWMCLPGKTAGYLDGNTLPGYIDWNLDGNKIGEIGCKGLSRGNWPSLEQINLGKNVLIKAGISWGKKDWPTSQKQNGRRSRQFF